MVILFAVHISSCIFQFIYLSCERIKTFVTFKLSSENDIYAIYIHRNITEHFTVNQMKKASNEMLLKLYLF